MAYDLRQLKPEHLWRHFDELRKIPRCSGNEAGAGDYVISVAHRLGLAWERDEVGNIVVRKPASPGHEGAETIVLQGHLDMVCEKNSDVEHDFRKDPIEVERRGDWLTAMGTTLGSDNGIGVAAALAVLEDRALIHGPLECLFTVDEETGLTGASHLKPGFLKGRKLINLDSEEEGVLFIGCAGGGDNEVTLPIRRDPAFSGARIRIGVTGLRGGHSGIDIDKGRANAIRVVARLIYELGKTAPVRLVSVEGGNKRNAIPREAEAVVVVAEQELGRVEEVLRQSFAAIRFEYKAVETEMALDVRAVEDPRAPMAADSHLRTIGLLLGLPHGVLAMSQEMPGLVETSNNLAVVRTMNDQVQISLSSRSSIMSALNATRDIIRAVAEMVGATVEQGGGYPAWTPNLNSPLLRAVQEVHRQLFGKEAEVKAIHAGLETGIIGEKFPGMDMISMGPQIEHPHSPDERVNIPSVERFWNFLTKVLEALA
ncbi:MAG: aminoacyl-histidine dipeptidase [candidate division KSB1 bacterium]|nr:aminoacyl-histidine dipeptidase [candidate division KSB1 bacterium]